MSHLPRKCPRPQRDRGPSRAGKGTCGRCLPSSSSCPLLYRPLLSRPLPCDPPTVWIALNSRPWTERVSGNSSPHIIRLSLLRPPFSLRDEGKGLGNSRARKWRAPGFPFWSRFCLLENSILSPANEICLGFGVPVAMPGPSSLVLGVGSIPRSWA